MISDFGKILDPIADKLTQGAMMLCLVLKFPWILLLFALLIIKESYMTISGLHIIRKTGQVMGADWHGKLAAVCLFIILLLHIFWATIPTIVSVLSISGCSLIVILSFVLYAVRNTKAIATNDNKEIMDKERIQTKIIRWTKNVASFILNPRFLLCFGIAWILTNGWSYILMAVGTYFKIGWMMAVAGAYLAFLWLPVSPEKLATFAIAIFLLKRIFPNDTKTLAVLKNLSEKAKSVFRAKKRQYSEKKANTKLSGIGEQKEMSQNRSKEFYRNVIPCVLSMASMALFSVVDGVFVSNAVGSVALAGINVVYPVILVLVALSAMLALGASTLIASRLAVGESEKANRTLNSCIWFSLVAFAVVGIVCIVFPEKIARLLGAEGEILYHAASYLRSYMFFAIPCGGVTVIAAAVRNDNNPSLASLSTVVASLLNIFGDWLFVFPLKMGAAGAAYASGISQTIGLAVLMYHFAAKKGELHLNFRIKPQWKDCCNILLRGAPECVNQLTTPVTTVCFNLIIAELLGDIGLETYSIIAQPVSIVIMLLIGVADGTQPLFSRSYSTGDKAGERYYFKMAAISNIIISAAVYLCFTFFGDYIFRIFTSEQALIDAAMYGTRLYGISFLFTAIITVISCCFMSTLVTKKAMLINISRTFIFNVLFILITPYILGTDLLWLGIVISELVVLIIAIVLYRRHKKNEKA